jgi:hypothetical protein
MTRILLLIAASSLTLTACQSATSRYMASSTEVKRAIVEYEITGLSYNDAADAISEATRRTVRRVNIQRNLGSADLPTAPGRIELVDPFAGTNMRGFAALAGAGALQMAHCPDARLVITATDDTWASHGESAQYTNCLWEYGGGLRFATYSAYTEQRGMSMEQLVRQAAEPLLGDSQAVIERSHAEILARLASQGAQVFEVSRRES